MAYSGWFLDDTERHRLLELFPTLYPDVLAHHITSTKGGSTLVAPNAADIAIVGMVDDAAGVQALVVSVDGETTRPDGRTYHITWSINREIGRKPVHSNDAIANNDVVPLPCPIPIAACPGIA